MAGMTYKMVAAAIRQGTFSNVYYFYGADVVQVQQLTQLLCQKATGGNPEMALTKLEGETLDVQQLREQVQLFPMLAPYNCIWIHDFQAEKCREEAFRQLLDLLSELGEQTIVVFDVTGFDLKNGRKTVSGKNKKLLDCIGKHGVVCEMPMRSTAVLAKELSGTAARCGCTLPRESAEELVRLCMGDTLKMQNELEKLCAYAATEPVSIELVRTMVTPTPETTTFALAKAVVSLQTKTAMEELDRLYAMRTSRTFLVHTLMAAFLDLYRASAAFHSRRTPEQMKEDFGYTLDFVVSNAFRDCRRIAPERLRQCIAILRDLEYQLNATACEERIAVETAIVKMLAAAAGTGRSRSYDFN